MQLPQTGQKICYAVGGNIISCLGTGQDGELQEGNPWPSPRFIDNGDQTQTDNLTELIWPKDASTPGVATCLGETKTWQGALDYIACLNTNNYLGHNDWRLPNINELESFVNEGQSNPAEWLNGQGFSDVQSTLYWSSTSEADSPSRAWVVNMVDVFVYEVSKSLSYHVWPVRGGQSGSLNPSAIWRTGQTVCYDPSGASNAVIPCAGTGQDRELQEGVVWPSPRFTDNEDQSVTDNLTNLVWTKNANAPGPSACWFWLGTYMRWLVAFNYVTCLNTNNYLGHNDWRLPNIKELNSLTDFSQYNPSLPSGHPFTNVQSDGYASSSSSAYNPSDMWGVNMYDGGMVNVSKSFNYYVWPVRDGQSGSLGYLTLSVSNAGTGSGTVTSSPSGISCGSTCSASYSAGTSVTLTAAANSGSAFTGWSGSCSSQSSSTTCVVTMNAAETVTANYVITGTTPFGDVPSSESFASFIETIYNNGITTGCGNGDYCPSENVTRDQMAAFIIRALYGETFSYTQTPYFTDVPSADTFFKYIQKMKDMGITTVSGTYLPSEDVTRDQVAAFLIRATQIKAGQGTDNFVYTTTPYFTDVPVTDPYFKYIQKLKDLNITTMSGTYIPSEDVTRDQMAAFLARAFLGMVNTFQMGGGIQGNRLSLFNTVTTIAGYARSADGTGAEASFFFPRGITTDGTNSYVVDTNNSIIRKIAISSGIVTTVAGSARTYGSADGIGSAASFKYPTGIATDGINLYVADSSNSTIRKIVISTGAVTTLAGAAGAPGWTNGVGAAARFTSPGGITTDGTNLYVVDGGSSTIRKIVIATGAVTTLAGTTGFMGSADGIGSAASFEFPTGITTDGTNLYVADSGNNTIRKIVISNGTVTTLAGSPGIAGFADGVGSTASFNSPRDITTDGINLYVADSGNNIIRKIVLSTVTVTTLAGTPRTEGSVNGVGSVARFEFPTGITTDGTILYVADSGNNTIREIAISTGTVTTLAGAAGASKSVDGIGSAASFSNPAGITTDGTNLYVADLGSNTIRKIVISTGAVSTLAGSPGTAGWADGIGVAASFTRPIGITTDGANLYVADAGNNTIRKIVIFTGVVTTLAGAAGTSGWTDGVGSAARFNGPRGITTDGTNLYVADTLSGTIRMIIVSTGTVTTLAGAASNTVAWGADGIGSAARFGEPIGITTDGRILYVADSGTNTIRMIVISTGVVSTLAGTNNTSGSVDGIGSAASFNGPSGIITDGINLYTADSDNDTIRKIVISTGAVTTLAGTARIAGSADGTGLAARFSTPSCITSDGIDLYVTDAYNKTIRKIQ